MVERIKTGELPIPTSAPTRHPCPRCCGRIHEGYKHFNCEEVRLPPVEGGLPAASGSRRKWTNCFPSV